MTNTRKGGEGASTSCLPLSVLPHPLVSALTSCSRELYSPSVCSRMITRSRLLCRVMYPGSDFTWTTLANKSNLRLRANSHQFCAGPQHPLTKPTHPPTSAAYHRKLIRPYTPSGYRSSLWKQSVGGSRVRQRSSRNWGPISYESHIT